MRRISVKKVNDALVEFCIEQTMGSVDICKINNLVKWSLDSVMECERKHLLARKIMSYTVYKDRKAVDDLLYNGAHENSVICENGIVLGKFMIKDSSYIDSGALSFTCGYDVVYDTDKDEILLLYIVGAVSNDGTMTIYRVPTDVFEDFELNGFMIDLTAQMCLNIF